MHLLFNPSSAYFDVLRTARQIEIDINVNEKKN